MSKLLSSATKILRIIGSCEQRQDSAKSQLEDLYKIANLTGMYDAADLIKKLLDKSTKESDEELASMYHEICDKVHSGCNSKCPIYEKYNGVPLTSDKSSCRFFKNGKAILKDLRKVS